MSFSESYDNCMAANHMPLVGAILSHMTLTEALEMFEELDQALEAAGGKELTFSTLAAAGAGAGLTGSTAELFGLLVAGAADVTVFVYMGIATTCLSTAILKNSLLSELEAAPSSSFKDQVQSEAESGQTATA